MPKVYRVGDVYHCRIWTGGKEYRRSTGMQNIRDARQRAAEIEADLRAEAAPEELYARALIKDGFTPTASQPIREQVVLHLASRMPLATVGDILIGLARRAEADESDPEKQHRLRANRLALARRLTGEQAQRIALADMFKAWESAPKRRDPGHVTVESMYRPVSARFTKWAKSIGRTYLHELTEADAVAYLGYLKKQGFSPRTIKGDRTFLKAVWRALTVQGGLADIWSRTPLPEPERNIRDALTPADLHKLFAAAEGAEQKALLGLGLYAGLRLGDAATLPLSAIDYSRGIIELRPKKTANRYGTVARIPILPPLEKLLGAVRRRPGATHALPKIGTMYNTNRGTVQNLARDIFARAGIDTALKREKGRKRARSLGAFHRLRHSFVSACARAGVPPAAVRQMTGHSTVAVQMMYEHLPDKDLVASAKNLPDTLAVDAPSPPQQPIRVEATTARSRVRKGGN